MQKKILIILFVLFSLHNCFAQKKKYTISGYINEKGSKETLIGAAIYSPQFKTGSTSNGYGFFSLTLPETDSLELIITYVGYQPIVNKVNLNKNISLNFEMTSGVLLNEVNIVANKEVISQSTKISNIEIPIEQVKSIPAFLGEKDVIKVLQLMSGVQKGSEGSSGLYIRGGGADQNLIILDDATMYSTNHTFGFFSLFNGDAIKNIELYKGGFPARYGGRLSSVVDIKMKEGSKDKYKGEVGIGIISSRLNFEGPIKKGKSSFLVSGRRTYIDILMRPFMKDEVGGYFFYDGNAKLNFDLDPKNKLFISSYFGRDKVYMSESNNSFVDKFGIYWGNATGTIRWNHVINNKMFANTSLILSDYRLVNYRKANDDGGNFEYKYTMGIADLAAKFDFDYIPNPNHLIKTGFILTGHRYMPSSFEMKSSYFQNENIVSKTECLESAIYLEDEIIINEKLKTNIGIRISSFQNEELFIHTEPRANINYEFIKGFSAKASYTNMNQYTHIVSPSGMSLPLDIWLPASKNIKPQNSNQYALGLAKDLPKQKLAVSIEGYYKESKNVISFKEGASYILIDDPNTSDVKDWENSLTAGKGWSYGTEFLIQKKFGKLTGWIGYTLSWTQLQFDDINLGRKFYAKYDRRHDASITMIYDINENYKFSCSWIYGTGQAISLPYQKAPLAENPDNLDITNISFGRDFNIYENKNHYRTRSFHRLDMSIQFIKNRTKYTKIIELGIYNAYNRKNPFFMSTYITKDKRLILKQYSLFPIIPSISYTIKF